MRIATLGLSCLVPALLAAACTDRDARFDRALALAGPYLVEGHAAWTSGGREGVLVLEEATSRVRLVPTSGPPTVAVPDVEARALLVLSAGAETLDLVDLDRPGLLETWALGSPFDAVTVSDDGRFALASFAGGGGGALANASEVAVVDLDEAPSQLNPTLRTVASAGGAVRGIDVSPPFGPDGRRVALLRSTNHLAAIDLSQPLGATRSIPLVAPGSGATVVPQRVVFAVAGDVLHAFVVTSGLDDVYHLRFDGASSDDGAPLPTLNQFAVGRGPADLATWVDGDGRLQLVVVSAASRELTVLDVATAQAVAVPLDAAATRLLLYGGEGAATRALVWGPPGGSRRFFRVALGEIPVKKSKAVEPRDLVANIQSVTPVAGGDWFLVTHPVSGAAVTLVSAVDARILPFTGSGTILGHAVDADGSSVFLASAASDGAALSVIDVATGHPESMDLPGAAVTGLWRIPGTDTLLVAREDPAGQVTLVSADGIEEGRQRTVRGFALTGILEEDAE